MLGGINNSLTDTNNWSSVMLGGSGNTLNGGGKRRFMLGGEDNTMGGGNDSFSGIIGGENNTLTGHERSVIIGGDTLSTTKDDEVVVPNLTIDGTVSGSAGLVDFESDVQITGSAEITGSLGITGSVDISGTSLMLNSVSAGAPSVGEANIVAGAGNPTLGANARATALLGATNATIGSGAFQVGILGGDGNQANAIRTAAIGGYQQLATTQNISVFTIYDIILHFLVFLDEI